MRPAVILAGGHGHRIGGDKPFTHLSGTPLLDRVLERLKAQAHPIALNADTRDPRFHVYALPILPDSHADRRGPLAGLAAAMTWARTCLYCDRVGIVPVDAPFLPSDCLDRLFASTSAISVAASGGRIHPVVGCFSVSLLEDLEAHLNGHARTSVMAWIDRHAPEVVPFGPTDINGQRIDPFFNINTPDELITAERILDPDLFVPDDGSRRNG